MRRFFIGLAMIAALGVIPGRAKGNDRQIANKIAQTLQQHKDKGELRGIDIDLQVEKGAVHLLGEVASEEQERIALDAARHVPGVRKVYNELIICEPTKASSDARVADKPKAIPASTSKVEADPADESEATPAIAENTPDSQEILDRVYSKLTAEKASGRLKGFALDLEVDGDVVTLKGTAANADQQEQIAEIVRLVPGVTKVKNEMTIAKSKEKASDKLAQEVIQRLKAKKDSGELKSFRLDVQVEEGIVWLSGYVADEGQRQIVLETTRYIPGVVKVVNDLSISSPQKHRTTPVRAVADNGNSRRNPSPPPDEADGHTHYAAPRPLQDGAVGSSVAYEQGGVHLPQFPEQPSIPAPSLDGDESDGGRPSVQYVWVPANQLPPGQYGFQPSAAGHQAPLAFAPARSANYQEVGGVTHSGEPVPMSPAAPGVGIAPARFDHPQMPNYAWPSYAPYPNYGAVTYPKQYSPMAWPYIGPFYPYPQVPLGWRKVTLEWDDGWWQLDFKSRRH